MNAGGLLFPRDRTTGSIFTGISVGSRRYAASPGTLLTQAE
jgi:hypothetical protein